MKGKAKAAEFTDEGFKIQVTGRNVLVTDAMKDYATDKISKMERFSHRIIDVIVTMDVQKMDHRVDIIMKIDHVKIKSHASSTDMYASLDKAINKLQNQLRRYKSRINDHTAKSLNKVDMNVNVYKRPPEAELIDVNLDIEDETQRQMFEDYAPREIVSTKKKALSKLTHDEAVMRMVLSGDPFLIFRSEEDQKLKVIYRRKDDNFGVIEVET